MLRPNQVKRGDTISCWTYRYRSWRRYKFIMYWKGTIIAERDGKLFFFSPRYAKEDHQEYNVGDTNDM